MGKNTNIKEPSNSAYKFRIYPDEEQIELIEHSLRLNRDVYNYFLGIDVDSSNIATLLYFKSIYPNDVITHEKFVETNKRKSFIKNGEVINFDDVNKIELREFIKKYKKDNNLFFNKFDGYKNFKKFINLEENKEKYEYVKYTHSTIINTTSNDLNNAFDKCYKKQGGYPKFKSRYESLQSFGLQQMNDTIKIEVVKESNSGYISYIKLPKIKKGINIRIHRKEFLDLWLSKSIKIKQVVVSKNATDQYFVSIMVHNPNLLSIPEKSEINYETSIGIDANIGHLNINDNELKIDKIINKYMDELKELERQISFKIGSKKGEDKSNSYLNLRKKINKIHLKIKNMRDYRNHMLAKKLIDNPEYDNIIFEKLDIKNMVERSENETEISKQNTKNKRSMRRNIHDMAWSDLQKKTEQKSKQTNKNVLYIEPQNTSKTCNNCGYINEELTLKDRKWNCPVCGKEINRDENASKNIKDKYFKAGVFKL